MLDFSYPLEEVNGHTRTLLGWKSDMAPDKSVHILHSYITLPTSYRKTESLSLITLPNSASLLLFSTFDKSEGLSIALILPAEKALLRIAALTAVRARCIFQQER